MEEETHPMDREYKKGQRLHIDTRDFSFEGTVCFTDPAHDMLSLANVIYRPSGKQRFSRINVFRVDVKRIIMLDDGGVAKAAAEEKAAKEEQRVEKYLKLLHTAKDYVFIDKINNLFKRSVEAIHRESTVGIYIEGRFRRGTKLSVLCVSTPNDVFVFDLQTLGEEALSNGLRALLESTEVEKIIHDSRFISDCLKHTYEVSLNRVFDTQVADLMVRKERYGEFPRYVRSLSKCLEKYLNLPENVLKLPEFDHRTHFMNWRTRPLSMELQLAAAKSTVLLFELRKELQAEMMKPFYTAVNLFCDVVRISDDYDADQHRGGMEKVPRELLLLKE